MKIHIIQDYACVIMGVYESKKDAVANLQEGWYVTTYEVIPKNKQPKTTKQ